MEDQIGDVAAAADVLHYRRMLKPHQNGLRRGQKTGQDEPSVSEAARMSPAFVGSGNVGSATIHAAAAATPPTYG